MTNAMIILLESVKLMEDGVIEKSITGDKVLTPDGKEVDMPEPIHTFQAWKSLGYKVKAGEHAIAKFPIWKYTSKKVEDENGEEINKDKMIMKTACFFKKSQVEKVEVN